MSLPEKIDFFGISSPAKNTELRSVLTDGSVFLSGCPRKSSSGIQQVVSMELLYPIIDKIVGHRNMIALCVFDYCQSQGNTSSEVDDYHEKDAPSFAMSDPQSRQSHPDCSDICRRKSGSVFSKPGILCSFIASRNPCKLLYSHCRIWNCKYRLDQRYP